MKNLTYLTCFFLLFTISAKAQYTEVINSNRPGNSVSAFSVGKNVIQGEAGFLFEKREHDLLRTSSNLKSGEFAVRYGFLFEQLEIIWNGTFTNQNITDNSTSPAYKYSRTDFTQNTVGLKFLVFDPFKNPETNKPNLYSWRANNRPQWSDLIPAVALYAGMNMNFGDNPYYPTESTVSPKVMLATQNHISWNWVLVSNLIYDKFTEDDPMFSYIITLTHTLKNPKYSIFAEHQGFKSDAYGDGLFRLGGATLINKDLQLDFSIGLNTKDTPSRFLAGMGISYRLDYHEDEFKKVDNVSKQEKKALRKQKKRQRKNNSFKGLDN
ncbi:transporter [Zhouia amylolytica]|uniref:transporter n=1 Tax=Zhouia amylolytica TaxID=376730 RepID=UPI0020CF224A|nr:transporter [Zhouia amylolytica]MCQ0112202.1 transporter [Zhouia amylolytica]